MMVLERRGVIVMFMAIVVKNPAASWVEIELIWPCTD